MLYIFVAVMLFTLNSVIRYTSKFDDHPPATRVRPILEFLLQTVYNMLFLDLATTFIYKREREL